MIAQHDLFISGFSICTCADLTHTGVAYSVTKLHKANAVVLIVLEFVPHFELDSFFNRFCLVANFIFVLCMSSMWFDVRSRITLKY